MLTRILPHKNTIKDILPSLYKALRAPTAALNGLVLLIGIAHWAETVIGEASTSNRLVSSTKDVIIFDDLYF